MPLGQWHGGKRHETSLASVSCAVSEWRMEPMRWREVALLVQLIYNRAPATSLNGLALVTVMTGLAAMPPLDPLAFSGTLGKTT
jgi:hypothetical protein